MNLSKIMLAIAAVTASGGAMAHGFITSPETRAYLCQQGQNADCGQAQYEPQSVGEGPDGFPAAGPQDGNLASANGGTDWIGVKLNEQTADRWKKLPMQAGTQEFTWRFTAAHPIASIKYYMTKEGWNPNQPITRDSLDLTPFCVIPSAPASTTGSTTHTCDVPERSGYHVIYGLWDVADTAGTFHNMIDVEFEESYEDIPSEWSNTIGNLTPTIDLPAGSLVKARLFNANGEMTDREITLTINSAAQGEKNVWAHALASKINETEELRAGRKNSTGGVNPVYGVNTIYTKADTGLTQVIVAPIPADEANIGSFSVNGLQNHYEIVEGNAQVGFNLAVTGKLTLEGQIFDANNQSKGIFNAEVDNATQAINVDLADVTAGKYTMVIIGTNANGQSLQDSFEITLRPESNAGDFEYVYPDGIGSYVSGTVVMNPATDKAYECKAGVAAWCNIPGNIHYAPGVGHAWTAAWTEK